MSEKSPPGLDEIHGSLTAPLLPSLQGSEVLAAPAAPLRPKNPTLPTLSWDPTAPAGVVSAPPPPATDPGPQVVNREPLAPEPPNEVPQPSVPVVGELPASPMTTSDSPPPAVADAQAPEPPPTPIPATVPADPGQMAPSLPAVVPAVSPASGMPAFAPQFEPPTAEARPRRRVRESVGAIVRTVLIAALVAGAVFAGRYAWQWNQDREADTVAAEVLPATPVPAVDARFVEFRRGVAPPVSAHVDLASGDFVADISTARVARRGGQYWMGGAADGVWMPASAEFLVDAADAIATVEQAALVMVSDVLPVEVYPYATVADDEVVALPGRAIDGPEVIELSAPDEAGADDVTDGRPVAPQVVGEVVVRHLTVTVDGLALRSADPLLAASSGLGADSSFVIEIWIDPTGVVRKMSTSADLPGLAATYELVSTSLDGPGPLDDLALPDSPPAPPSDEVAG